MKLYIKTNNNIIIDYCTELENRQNESWIKYNDYNQRHMYEILRHMNNINEIEDYELIINDVPLYEIKNNKIIKRNKIDIENDKNQIEIEKKYKLLRVIREEMFNKTEYIKQRHTKQKEAIEKNITDKNTTITEAKYNEWLLYWQQLRDLPEKNLLNVDDVYSIFPTMPQEAGKK